MGDETGRLSIEPWGIEPPPDDGEQEPPPTQGHAAGGPLIVPPPSDPMAVARRLINEYLIDGVLTVRQWRGGWMVWKQTHWAEAEPTEIKSSIYRHLEHAYYPKPGSKRLALEPWEPTRYKVANVAEALTAITYLPEHVNPPAWLAHADTREPAESIAVNADEIVSCDNGLLDVGSRKLIERTPSYFNRVSVPFDYDPSAPVPRKWLTFLDQLWPDDRESVDALREWFGYVLSGRTDMHKILLLVGPTRSGKGTIARVLGALVGKGNVAGPTLASLGTNFGLSPLLGKPLAVVSDARLGGANVHQVVERLLSVSGEDTLTVDRKYREPWTGQLPTRFLLLSNELPRFGDASGAIAHRFVVLMMAESFLGRENTKLTGELLGELPGIFNWSLDGLDRIFTTDAFTEPASSTDAIIALADLVSPVSAFVRDRCQKGPGAEVAIHTLFAAWRSWCDDNGHKPGSASTFGRDLRAVLPQLRVRQHRGSESRDRYYVGITLTTTHNGETRVNRVPVADRLPICPIPKGWHAVARVQTHCCPKSAKPAHAHSQSRKRNTLCSATTAFNAPETRRAHDHAHGRAGRPVTDPPGTHRLPVRTRLVPYRAGQTQCWRSPDPDGRGFYTLAAAVRHAVAADQGAPHAGGDIVTTGLCCTRCGRAVSKQAAVLTSVGVMCRKHAVRLPPHMRRPPKQRPKASST
jgi:putative DNA primase/helicase